MVAIFILMQVYIRRHPEEGRIRTFQQTLTTLTRTTLRLLYSLKFYLLQEDHQYLVGGLEHEFYFSISYGMSSFPLTNSIIFQDGYCTTNL